MNSGARSGAALAADGYPARFGPNMPSPNRIENQAAPGKPPSASAGLPMLSKPIPRHFAAEQMHHARSLAAAACCEIFWPEWVPERMDRVAGYDPKRLPAMGRRDALGR
jgi:hypothetical protein